MTRYSVDVKAFISVDVEADTPEDARIVADAFVENAMWVTAEQVRGYNSAVDDDAVGHIVPGDYWPSVDGDSDVE